MEEDRKSFRCRASVPVFFVLVVSLYLGTLNAGFFFDDFPRIIENPGLGEPLSLKKIVTVGMPSRPFLMLTLALNKYLGGTVSFGYHLLNTGLHALNVILLFGVATRLLAFLPGAPENRWPRLLPFAASILFAVHPLQTESVSYCISRGEELCTLFYLLAVSFYLKAGAGRAANYPAVFLFALLAVLSKEIAVTLPAVFFLIDYFFITGCGLRMSLKKSLRLLPLSLIIMGAAVTLVKMDAGVGVYERGVYSNLVTQVNVAAYYLKLLFFPINQAFDYDFPEFKGLGEPPALLCLLLLLGLVAIAVRFRRKERILAFSLLWFFITLSPTSSVVPVDDIIYEHRLYLPLAGFSLVQGTLLLAAVRGLRTGFRAPFACLGLMAVWLFCTDSVGRNTIYLNDRTFWEDAVRKAPWKDRPNNNLATIYGNMGRYREAETLLKHALRASPWHPEARGNLGEVYFHLGRRKEAEREFKKVLKDHPDMPQANYFMGRLAEDRGRLDIARERYERALRKKPGLVPARNRLAEVWFKKGEPYQALFHFNKVLEKDPGNVEAHVNIGIIYGSLGFPERAVRHLKTALASDPKNPEILRDLSLVQGKRGMIADPQ